MSDVDVAPTFPSDVQFRSEQSGGDEELSSLGLINQEHTSYGQTGSSVTNCVIG
jgi:hypothetical protein